MNRNFVLVIVVVILALPVGAVSGVTSMHHGASPAPGTSPSPPSNLSPNYVPSPPPPYPWFASTNSGQGYSGSLSTAYAASTAYVFFYAQAQRWSSGNQPTMSYSTSSNVYSGTRYPAGYQFQNSSVLLWISIQLGYSSSQGATPFSVSFTLNNFPATSTVSWVAEDTPIGEGAPGGGGFSTFFSSGLQSSTIREKQTNYLVIYVVGDVSGGAVASVSPAQEFGYVFTSGVGGLMGEYLDWTSPGPSNMTISAAMTGYGVAVTFSIQRWWDQLAPQVHLYTHTTDTSIVANWTYVQTSPYISSTVSYYYIGLWGPDINTDPFYASPPWPAALNETNATSVSYTGLLGGACYHVYVAPMAWITWLGITALIDSGQQGTFTNINAPDVCTQFPGPTLMVSANDSTIFLGIMQTSIPDVYSQATGYTFANWYVDNERVRYGLAASNGCVGTTYTVSGVLGAQYGGPAYIQYTLISGSTGNAGGGGAGFYSWNVTIALTHDITHGDTYCIEAQTVGFNYQNSTGINNGLWSQPYEITVVNQSVGVDPVPPVIPRTPNSPFPRTNNSAQFVVLSLPPYIGFGGAYQSTVSWTNDLGSTFSNEFVLQSSWLRYATSVQVTASGRSLTAVNEFGVGNSTIYIFPGSVTASPNATVTFVVTFNYSPPSPLTSGVVVNGGFLALGTLFTYLAVVVVAVMSYLSIVMKRVGLSGVIGTIIIFLTVGVELFSR